MNDGLARILVGKLGALWETALSLLFAAGSHYSVTSLFCAFCVGVLFVFLSRRRRRDVKLSVMLRAVLPRWLVRSASSRADILFLALNTFVFPAGFAYAVVSSHAVGGWTIGLLAGTFGAMPATTWPPLVVQAVATVALFLAYELAYWCDHALSHHVPFLWEFHKVHHTAEHLSPLTNARVHPVDTAVFANFIAVYTGLTAGALAYLFGRSPEPFAVGSTNVILLVFLYLVVHLQHSHFWIAFTGPLGRVFLSPAHHQIHHSDDPAHFNKNFGSCLSLWDGMFGTLHMPGPQRQRLVFGAGPRLAANHSIPRALFDPFVAVARRITGSTRPELAEAPPVATDAR